MCARDRDPAGHMGMGSNGLHHTSAPEEAMSPYPTVDGCRGEGGSEGRGGGQGLGTSAIFGATCGSATAAHLRRGREADPHAIPVP